jgi:predicted nucleic acid-binding protein
MALPDVETLCTTLIDTCEMVDSSVRTHQTALTLMARYNLSVYDANIVAAAALSDCAVLYSEDMQDGLNIKLPGPTSANALAIRNPFRA